MEPQQTSLGKIPPAGNREVTLTTFDPSTSSHRSTHAIWLILFLLALLLPINFSLGGIRLNPSRLFLILTAIPFGLQLFTGKAGRFTLVDGCMLGFVILIPVSLIIHHGTTIAPYALSQMVEMFGGYMAGRILIRSAHDYHKFIKLFLLSLLIMLPFGVDELFHYRMLIADAFRKIFEVVPKNDQSRFGLSRVQVVFPHAILYGLFCSLAFGSVFFLYRKMKLRRIFYLGLVGFMTMLSLSSAPLLSLLLQTALITWEKLTRGAWGALVTLFVSLFAFLQIFSNRGAFVIFIETMTLDPSTGWTRIYIWKYGIQAVISHPWFGIGLNDWDRPFWLTYSVDNFWLLMAMRYGLLCQFFLLSSFILHIAYIVRQRIVVDFDASVRLGYMITLTGLIFLLATVDVWDSLSIFVFFFLGAGAFLYTSDARDICAPSPAIERAEGTHTLLFSRFQQTSGRRGATPTAQLGQSHQRDAYHPKKQLPQ